MALAIQTVTNSIAALSVSGVTIKDIDEIPESVLVRDCPIMFPEPDNFISNFVYVRDSFGGGGVSKGHVTYNLTYAFLFTPIGVGRGLLDVYNDMVTKVGLILDEILNNDDITGAVDFQPLSPFQFGAVTDPAGAIFIGTRLIFQVSEFIN